MENSVFVQLASCFKLTFKADLKVYETNNFTQRIYTSNLPDSVTLIGVHDGGRTMPVSRDLLERAVSLQQQWRRLFVLKAEVAA